MRSCALPQKGLPGEHHWRLHGWLWNGIWAMNWQMMNLAGYPYCPCLTTKPCCKCNRERIHFFVAHTIVQGALGSNHDEWLISAYQPFVPPVKVQRASGFKVVGARQRDSCSLHGWRGRKSELNHCWIPRTEMGLIGANVTYLFLPCSNQYSSF